MVVEGKEEIQIRGRNDAGWLERGARAQAGPIPQRALLFLVPLPPTTFRVIL